MLNTIWRKLNQLSFPTNVSRKMFVKHVTHTSFDSNMKENSTGTGVSVIFAKDERKTLSPYEKLVYEAQNDARYKEEVKAGRRIGFYRILKNIGLGNFSKVKLGVHLLAKGIEEDIIFTFTFYFMFFFS